MDNIKALGDALGTALAPVFSEFKTIIVDQQKTIETLMGEVKELAENGQKSVFSFEDILKGQATMTQNGQKKHEPGIKAARFVKMAMLVQKAQKNGQAANLEDYAEKMYGKIDSNFAEEVKQISVSINEDGGYLIPEDYATEIVELLYSNTVVMELGARRLPMPNGNLNIPKLISGSSAAYIGENTKKNASNPKYANIKLSAKKLSNVVPISNDVLRSTDYSSDMYVRDDLVIQLALKMDLEFLQGTGSEFTPKGIKNLVPAANKVAVSDLPTTENTYTQVSVVEQANSLMQRPGWSFNAKMKGVLYNLKDGDGRYLHREELRRGEFHGFPYRISNQIPTSTASNKPSDIYFGDWAECLVGEQVQLVVKMSEEASYYNESGTLVSAFALDQTVMMGMMIHDFNVARPQTFTVYSYHTE